MRHNGATLLVATDLFRATTSRTFFLLHTIIRCYFRDVNKAKFIIIYFIAFYSIYIYIYIYIYILFNPVFLCCENTQIYNDVYWTRVNSHLTTIQTQHYYKIGVVIREQTWVQQYCLIYYILLVHAKYLCHPWGRWIFII